VRPFLWNSAVGVAPLHTARGIQNKVLEAVAAGLPVVVTPVVADGLPNEVLPACVVAGDATGFADAIVDRLALSPQERSAVTQAADLSGLSWAQRLQPLCDVLAEAGRAKVPTS